MCSSDLFNPIKSHLITFGGSNPPAVIQLSCKTLDGCSKVKYLGLYLISGINSRIDLIAAKQKYYGCFNNIKAVIWKQAGEIMLLKLIKTYCLPRLLYMCDIWPTETLDMHELDIQSNPLNVTTLNVTNRFMSQKFFSPASVHRN